MFRNTGRTVDELRRVVHNALDQLLPLKMSNSNTGQAAVDLETLNEDALADELEGGDFLENTIEGGLVERDSVLGLILDLSLRPLLLLGGLATAGGSGCCFCFGLQKHSVSCYVPHKLHPDPKMRIQLILLPRFRISTDTTHMAYRRLSWMRNG